MLSKRCGALTDNDLGVRLAAARLDRAGTAKSGHRQTLTAVAIGKKETKAPDPKAKKEITRDTAKERDDVLELRVQACRALAAIGEPAASALKPLLPLLKDPEATVRRETIATLLAIGVGGDPKTVGEPLLPLLLDKSQLGCVPRCGYVAAIGAQGG